MLIGLLAGIFILTFLICAHELGHLWAARKSGVVVREFGIGLPPRIYKKKLKNKIILSVNWLPIGGFVRLKGEYDSAKKPGDYGAARFIDKTKILFAGVAVNWIIAIIIISILSILGLPKIIENQFYIGADAKINKQAVTLSYVLKGSPADSAKLMVGDRIVEFNEANELSISDIQAIIKNNQDKIVPIMVERNGKVFTSSIDLSKKNDKAAIMGIGMNQPEEIVSTWSAPLVGLIVTGQLTVETFKGIGDLAANLSSAVVNKFSNNQAIRDKADKNLQMAGDSVTGPIGLVGHIIPNVAKEGFLKLMLLTAIISLSLAVMNVMPLPALDGGRWLLTFVYRLRKKPLTKVAESKAQSVGFGIIIVLILMVTIADVFKFI